MAELDTSSGGNKKGKKGPKKQSTKVDMTPMVDLGFLLITFFMLTTTFSKPQKMDIQMPIKDPKNENKANTDEGKTITIFLDEKDQIKWYIGMLANKPKVNKTDYSAAGLRGLLNEKLQNLGPDVVVIVKPTNKSRFKNMVDAIDELRITGIKFYSVGDITPEEKTYLEANK